MAACSLLGCGTTSSSYNPAPGAAKIPASALFSVGEVKDDSGSRPSSNKTAAFDLAKAMRSSLQAELDRNHLSAAGGYTINVQIKDYEPGNAFKRWLMPGWGATRLVVRATILDARKEEVANIPVEKTVSAGGGYTIGAYEYVFDDVAKEIVTALKDSRNR